MKPLLNKLKLEKLPKKEKKFILVMVDGFGYHNLKELQDTKYMPFISKLLKKYNITPYNVGLPSTTPYVQAGIFYNKNDIIPGFRYYDKEKEKEVVSGYPKTAKELEIELEKNYPGILKGGASIGNHFTGGATRNIFTLPAIYTQSNLTNVRDIATILILKPIAFIRVNFYSLKEFMIEIFENIKDNVNKEYANLSFFYPYFPFFRLGINAIFKEVATEAAILEIKRENPKISINFNGYDWLSHYRGPKHKSTKKVLKEIDKNIKRLYKHAKKNNYDFYIYSDHSQVPSIPFDKVYNQTLNELVTRIKNNKRHLRDTTFDYFLYKLNFYYENFSQPLRILIKPFLKLFYFPKKETIKREISVHNSSCISHIYSKNPIDSDLINKLVSHDGIGMVIQKEPYKILSKHKEPLKIYNITEKQLETFSKQKHFGDLFVIGDIKGDKIISFEDFHLGSHDGFGLNQDVGFFISKEKYDFSKSEDSRVLHHVFTSY
ncbi:MAG: alkaline phosphatase family protein [archaeon]